MDKQDIFVSVVGIVQNGEKYIPAFVRETVETLDSRYTNFEVIVLDNGSSDDTAAAMRPLLQSIKCLRYVRLSRHVGSETTFTAALDAAIGDFVVTLNPDFDPPSEIPAMVELCRSGNDLVAGVDADPRQHSPVYRCLRSAYFSLARRMLGVDLPRATTGFRALSRHAVNALTQYRQRRRYFALAASAIGLTMATHPYRLISRSGGRPHSSIWSAARIGASVIVHNSTLPLRLVSLIGLIGSLLSFLYSLYVVAIFLFKQDVMPGWTTLSLQVSGLFFLVFTMMALLGEYMGRLLEESSDRPQYYVREEKTSAVAFADPTRRNVLDRSADDAMQPGATDAR
jgi:glycosyltransferase involved in cell wall biosynthesis